MSCRTQYRTPPGPPAPSIAHVANADRQQQAACQSGTILARFPAWIGSNMGNPSLDGLLFVPEGAGPFPAMVALHGAGGIFPYQAWWARQIANTGVVVLFLDSYCTRGYLCEHSTGDNDKKRGAIMRKWDKVSLKQRVLDAAAGYRFLTAREFIDNKSIGLVGWSWGGTTALFVQRSANRLQLPNGGFKGTIAFYPNLVHVQGHKQWKKGGKIGQPTLILYGKADVIEDENSYLALLGQGHPGPLKVVGFDGAVRKFDELGPHRIKGTSENSPFSGVVDLESG